MKQTRKTDLLVLFGGVSSEHEVSLMSATSILTNLDSQKYNILRAGITKAGRWLLYSGEASLIRNGDWEKSPACTPVALSPDRETHGLLVLKDGQYTVQNVDVIFPVLHGKNGEDGTVQGLFELCAIPYVGCGVLASAACMDKEFTHSMLTQNGILNAKFCCVHDYERENLPLIREKLAQADIHYPVFVKPANAGSSVGISKAHDESELPAALAVALDEDSKAILEETLVGVEAECAVMGCDPPVASKVVGEIEPLRELYDYEGKYCDDTTALHIPARLPNEVAREMQTTAVSAYRALGCRGLSRVDFFVETGTNRVILNEINTLPGFTDISMFPKLFCHSGMTYPELLDALIACAELGA